MTNRRSNSSMRAQKPSPRTLRPDFKMETISIVADEQLWS